MSPFLAPTLQPFELRLAAAAAVALSIAAATVLVYGTGGTQYAWPYLILLPVILAAAIFKVLGGILAALAAALALGPWMPLDVEFGIMQSTHNWLVRMAMYVAIGCFAGFVVTALDRQHRRTLDRARRDPGTGLLSASGVRQKLTERQAAGIRAVQVLAVGVESQQRVAISTGEEAAERLVARVGAAIDDILGRRGIVGRLEADVLGVAIFGDRTEAMGVVQRIWSGLHGAVEIDGVALPIVTRVGAAALTAEDWGYRRPFRKARLALRNARESGRDLVRHSAALDRRASDAIALLADFESDLADGRFQLHLQPKLDLATGRVCGAEALCRWHHLRRGNVPPDLFISLVEQTALIGPFSRFVLERAAANLARWDRDGLDLTLAVNLSAHNLRDPKFIGFLRRLPARYGLSPRRMELELTESGMVADFRWMHRALLLLRASGFQVAMDDFGTGFATMRYLKDLPADWVKLDKSFVRDLPDDGRSLAIAASTATMCQRLGFRSIAEGVESAAAQQALHELGFDAIQGYHLARPMPSDEFEAWLRQRRNVQSRQSAAAG